MTLNISATSSGINANPVPVHVGRLLCPSLWGHSRNQQGLKCWQEPGPGSFLSGKVAANAYLAGRALYAHFECGGGKLGARVPSSCELAR